jgi:hypothetical protein
MYSTYTYLCLWYESLNSDALSDASTARGYYNRTASE